MFSELSDSFGKLHVPFSKDLGGGYMGGFGVGYMGGFGVGNTHENERHGHANASVVIPEDTYTR